MSEKIEHGTVEATDDAALVAHLTKAAGLRDALLDELVGLGATMSAAMDAIEGFVPCGHAFGVVIEGLAACAMSVDATQISQIAEAVRARSEHVADHRGVPQGQASGVRQGLGEGKEGQMRAQVLASLLGIAPIALRAMELGEMSDTVNVALARGLRVLGNADAGASELHAVLAGLGEASLVALAFGR